MTIECSRDKIIFVAENGTENHRATSDIEEGVETDSPWSRGSSTGWSIREVDNNL